MKSFLSILAGLVMLLGLSACGGSDEHDHGDHDHGDHDHGDHEHGDHEHGDHEH